MHICGSCWFRLLCLRHLTSAPHRKLLIFTKPSLDHIAWKPLAWSFVYSVCPPVGFIHNWSVYSLDLRISNAVFGVLLIPPFTAVVHLPGHQMDTTAATKRVLPSGRYDRAGKSAFEVLEKAHKALGGCYLFFYTGNIRSRIIYGCSSFQFLRLYGDREFLLEIREFFSRRLDGTSIRNETLKMWTVVPALHGSAATALPYHPNPKQGSKAHFKKLFKELDSLKDKKTPYILFWLPALEIKIQKAYPEDLGDEVFKSSAWMKWTTDTDIIMNILPIEKVMWEDRRPFQRQRTMPASRTQTVLCEFSGSGDNLDVLSAVDDQMQLDTESEYAADTPEWLDIESKRCNSPVRLTPVCCDGDRYVVVMPSVDAPKRGGKKLGCPLMVSGQLLLPVTPSLFSHSVVYFALPLHLQVSLSLYCEGESTIAQYNCQCSPFRTLGTCVHVQLYEKKAAYIASLDFPKNTIAPFYNGMGDVAGYYVPDQGILSRESVVLCPRPGRGDDDWRCCDPEHRDSCLHIIHAKEHRNSQGGTGISSRRGMNGVSGRRVPVEEFLSKVRSDSGEYNYMNRFALTCMVTNTLHQSPPLLQIWHLPLFLYLQCRRTMTNYRLLWKIFDWMDITDLPIIERSERMNWYCKGLQIVILTIFGVRCLLALTSWLHSITESAHNARCLP